QAEDGIRDWSVTGVQTCALPISRSSRTPARAPSPFPPRPGSQSASSTNRLERNDHGEDTFDRVTTSGGPPQSPAGRFSIPKPCRSEERRVGKEGRTRW